MSGRLFLLAYKQHILPSEHNEMPLSERHVVLVGHICIIRRRAGVQITKIKENREADKPARILYRHPFQPESLLPGPVPNRDSMAKLN